MGLEHLADLAAIRCEAATVRMLLEELEQLTGNEAEQVGQQLGERLEVLARRLHDASTSLARVHHGARGPVLLERVKP